MAPHEDALVEMVEVITGFARLLVCAVVVDGLPVIRAITPFSFSTAHHSGSLDVGIRAAGNVAATVECNEANKIAIGPAGRGTDREAVTAPEREAERHVGPGAAAGLVSAVVPAVIAEISR